MPGVEAKAEAQGKLVIVADIDLTLITNRHEMRGKDRLLVALARLAKVAEAKGLFLKNSDATGGMIQSWEEELGITGMPAIVEGGAFLRLPDGTTNCNPEDEARYARHNDDVEGFLRGDGFVVQRGNPIPFLRGQSLGSDAPEGERAALLTDRRLGTTIFFGTVGLNGVFARSPAVMWQTHELLLAEGLYPGGSDPEANGQRVDVSDIYAHSMVVQAGHDKTQGMDMLRDALELTDADTVWMVGDSKNDRIRGGWVLHAAVANAKPEFSALADFRSESEYAAGVAEAVHNAIDQWQASR